VVNSCFAVKLEETLLFGIYPSGNRPEIRELLLDFEEAFVL